MSNKTVGPNGVVPDTRTTFNSNVGLTEKTQPYRPADPKKLAKGGAPLAAITTNIIDGYPGQVHHQRLNAFWNNDPYWGNRK